MDEVFGVNNARVRLQLFTQSSKPAGMDIEIRLCCTAVASGCEHVSVCVCERCVCVYVYVRCVLVSG